jgi:hypothetical protein
LELGFCSSTPLLVIWLNWVWAHLIPLLIKPFWGLFGFSFPLGWALPHGYFGPFLHNLPWLLAFVAFVVWALTFKIFCLIYTSSSPLSSVMASMNGNDQDEG